MKSGAKNKAAAPSPNAIVIDAKPGSTRSSGIGEIDELIGGIRRGAITAVIGPQSSGRTTLMISALARATCDREACALVDASDVFDVSGAESAGVDLDRLLWVRCKGDVRRALKAAELVLTSGGFGLVILDLGSLTSDEEQSVPSSCWFRFRRAVENTPTSLLAIGTPGLAPSSAAVVLEMERGKARWSGAGRGQRAVSLFMGLDLIVRKRKPFPELKTGTIRTSVAGEILD